MLTQARLKEVLSYDPETGEFVWRVRTGSRADIGERAGGLHKHTKYWRIAIDGTRYRAHRLAWFYVHGFWPNKDLDHKDRDRSDCRISNLREATRGQNLANKKAHNSYGYKGIYRKRAKWGAQIMKDGERMFLGSFSTPEAAHAAYCEAARKLHGEFFCPG